MKMLSRDDVIIADGGLPSEAARAARAALT